MSRIVADLVVETQAAAAEAIARHYGRLNFSPVAHGSLEALAHLLDLGYDGDLAERLSLDQFIGFDHGEASAAFTRRLRPILHNKQVSHHIWAADDNQGLYSLFGRTTTDAAQRGFRPTRASALTRRALLDCRSYREAEKATTAEPSRKITIPSPLWVAALLLGDPRSAPSQTCALAAVQEFAHERINEAAAGAIDLSFAAVSEALTLIDNRWRTSKPIVASLQQNGPTVLLLCNLMAMRGWAAMRVDLAELSELSMRRGDGGNTTADALDRQLEALWIGVGEGTSEFIINPHRSALPSASEILNLVEGLPLPIPGADTVFEGGLRLSEDHSLVAAVSGTFGTGKTLFGLSLAASLAPLGCRTLFLSCEESEADVEGRLFEAAPRTLFRTLPLFRCLNESEFRLREPSRRRKRNGPDGGTGPVSWFAARHLRLNETSDGKVDPAGALIDLLNDTYDQAEMFAPWREDNTGEQLPRIARPVFIVDGLHQLFDVPDPSRVIESSLRRLVESCRKIGAIFVFSFSSETQALRRLEYHCDLIIELRRDGFSEPNEKPRRVFELSKARRQPARTGAHLFQIKGEAGLRLKPSIDSRLQRLRVERWWAPEVDEEVFLTDDPPPGFRRSEKSGSAAAELSIRNLSQTLVIGKGSSGKASFGLHLLHRRWFNRSHFANPFQLSLPMPEGRMVDPSDGAFRRAAREAGAIFPVDPPYLATRVLIVSFLYQREYYDDIMIRLNARRTGKVDRRPDRRATHYAILDDLTPYEFFTLPDRMRTDTIELYPGHLSPEDFVAKVEKALDAASASGVPYTGVLVDGLHNVFVQFPGLEKDSAFWGMFYAILRRRRVSVVTTHTEFDISAHPDSQESPTLSSRLQGYEFEQAHRKTAPLLSALVSGADYLFDLSPAYEAGALIYRLTPLAAVSGLVGQATYSWDKRRMRLETLSSGSLVARRRTETAAGVVGEKLLEVLTQIGRSAMS